MTGFSVFRDSRAILAENLTFLGGELVWSDISAGTLHRSPLAGSRDGSQDIVMPYGPPLSALALADDGGLVLAFADRIVRVDGETDAVHPLATIPHRRSSMRFNEGKCDPRGRFVVGSMDYDGLGDGAIYSVAADGSWRVIASGIGVANGFEWSDDGSRMYFADTSVSTLYVGDYSDDGELSNVEAFLTGLTFDGLARDTDGGFWAGINSDSTVVRFDASGRQTHEIALPAGHVTAVAFGGDDLATLFVASAREKLTEEELAAAPLAGGIFAVDTGMHGHPTHLFSTTSSTNR
jgi:sugar lactone lactonase YvrE